AIPAEYKGRASALEMHQIELGHKGDFFEQCEAEISLYDNDDESVDFEILGNANNEENVFCQGHARYAGLSIPKRINIKDHINNAERNQNNSSQEWIIPISVVETNTNIVIDHDMLKMVLHTAEKKIGLDTGDMLSKTIPDSIEAVRIFGRLDGEGYAWVRKGPQGKGMPENIIVDIHIVDTKGCMVLSLLGMCWRHGQYSMVMPPSKEKISNSNRSVPDNIRRPKGAMHKIAPWSERLLPDGAVTINKPKNIDLQTPLRVCERRDIQSPKNKPAIQLPLSFFGNRAKDKTVIMAEIVTLYGYENGIYSLHIDTPNERRNMLTSECCAHMVAALDALKRRTDLRVLILTGKEYSFLEGGTHHYNDALKCNLYKAIVEFPFPLIAAMEGDAFGPGFLIGALCDVMILCKDAVYGYTNPEDGLFPCDAEERLFVERFGRVSAKRFLYWTSNVYGRIMVEQGGKCPVTERENVFGNAKNIAAQMSTKSPKALFLLKQHLARSISSRASALARNEAMPLNNSETMREGTNTLAHTKGHLHIDVPTTGVMLVKIGKKALGRRRNEIVRDIIDVLGDQSTLSQYKAAVITSEHVGFFPEKIGKVQLSEIEELEKTLKGVPVPVIAALPKGATGIAWMITQYFDVTVYGDSASYSSKENLDDNEIKRREERVFAYRLGDDFGREIVLSEKTYTGQEISTRQPAAVVVPDGNVITEALLLAGFWSGLSSELIRSWKKGETRNMMQFIETYAKDQNHTDCEADTVGVKRKIPLKSKAVKATSYPPGIVLVTMEDRESKNMFSEALIAGIKEVFAILEEDRKYKVVIITGYDQYFASGGTKESLLAIQEGKTNFAENYFCDICLNCSIPVIAAVNGHSVGGGWTFGMYADFILLSEEGRFVNPYMNYGFTPGAGATYILAEKLGCDIARESMLTARYYSGKELRERGIGIPVLSKREIIAEGFALAKSLANKPRTLLSAMKKQWTAHMHEPLRKTFDLELGLHEKTFVGNANVIEKVSTEFNLSSNYAKGEINKEKYSIENKSTSAVSVLETKSAFEQGDERRIRHVSDTLRKLLSQELHLPEKEIEDDIQFVDLGLDSISGVTWMRKINETFKVSIETTKIYRYPTLKQMSGLVIEEMSSVYNNRALNEIEKSTKKKAENVSNGTAAELPIGDIQKNEVTSALKSLLAAELHLNENEIDEDASFIDLGLDSISGVTWMRAINKKFNTSIEATKIYSLTTLKKLSIHVGEEARKRSNFRIDKRYENYEKEIYKRRDEQPHSIPSVSTNAKELTSWRTLRMSRTGKAIGDMVKSMKIAVIGMAGRFPLAENVEMYWQNIANGKNCIREIPKARWDSEKWYYEGSPVKGKTNCKWMGLLENYDCFDPLFFNISPTEAESMDPQQRVFLETCWHTIENACCNPLTLSGSNCGVFVGCGHGDYHLLSRDLQISAHGFTGGDTSILAARIAYFLNLQGPCVSIETACSSSLVALASACDSLAYGSCDCALAGG
ncbi:MAG: hypothetical protein GF344_01120, partial [Chitinivibrionales bacterium]|nr:hypothetical protein [Chitinivibrionales bacterium]